MEKLPTTYQQYIHISKYSRFDYRLKRREIWPETVKRYIDFMKLKSSDVLNDFFDNEGQKAILNLEVMPSMRALMTAGLALEKENVAGYNCSFLSINNKRAFSEALYILMNGVGVGFSCERQEIAHLPLIPEGLSATDDLIVVGDSKEGWAKALHKLISSLWGGDIPKIDYSKVRPAGAVLKTFGGRASGPAPLKRLFTFVIEIFKRAKGRKLTSIEVHDIMCMIGEIVIVGGVRRSALISLSNLSDKRMRDAKTGNWYTENSHRSLANNSIAFTEKPSADIFLEEWLSLVRSRSGERGIFNRVAAQNQASRWGRRKKDLSYGTNPCSEIILRNQEFCNLSEVVIRPNDTLEMILDKVRIATIFGTVQSTLTKFNYLSEAWVRNTEEERLLGVSLTGIMDHTVFSGQEGFQKLTSWLNLMRDHARKVNEEIAELLNISPSSAITCVKPSGTVSQLVDCASGIHARHSEYYLRTVRADKKDPLYQFMTDKGVYHEDEIHRPESTGVFYFPIKSPENSIKRKERTSLEQLELWLLYQKEWCEHKPSVTIDVDENEWVEVGAWVYNHFDEICGVSFLPTSDNIYQQAPYQEITKEEYEAWIKSHPQPDIDWTELQKYEFEDYTVGAQTLACIGGVCDI